MMSSQTTPLNGWIDLSVAGSYAGVTTFAARFHPTDSERLVPRRMIGLEGELRNFLTEVGVAQPQLDTALVELKDKGMLVLRHILLSQDKLRRYVLMFERGSDPPKRRLKESTETGK